MPARPAIAGILENALAAGKFDAGAIEAVAALLWLGDRTAKFERRGEATTLVKEFWRARGGDEMYWDFQNERAACASCGESYKFENLAVCPNCFKLYCHGCGRACPCGHRALG